MAQLHDSLSSAEAVVSLASANEHFSLPQGVEKFYTGRLNLLNEVEDAFTTPSSPGQSRLQKRIVIFGMGGSGKTQFCCEYAQRYRYRLVHPMLMMSVILSMLSTVAIGASFGSTQARTH